jgi:hypothetical protein
MKIQLYGYGGELVIGSVPKEKYVYWKLRDEEELSDHVLGNLDDEDLGVPEGLGLGEWYELDDLEHLNGASYEHGMVYVTDDDGNEIFHKSLSDINSMDGCEDVVQTEEGFDIEFTKQSHIFMAYSAEKGTFIALNVPGNEFDPAKLKVTVRETEGFEIVDGFWYDHPETEDAEELSTDGKSWECWLTSTDSDDGDED